MAGVGTSSMLYLPSDGSLRILSAGNCFDWDWLQAPASVGQGSKTERIACICTMTFLVVLILALAAFTVPAAVTFYRVRRRGLVNTVVL